MIRLTLDIDDAMAKRLQEVAEITQTPLADLVGVALRLRYSSHFVEQLRLLNRQREETPNVVPFVPRGRRKK